MISPLGSLVLIVARCASDFVFVARYFVPFVCLPSALLGLALFMYGIK